MRLLSKSDRQYDAAVLFAVMSVFIIFGQLTISADYGHLKIFGIQLPQLCSLRQITTLGCPFCGVTRSLHFCVMRQFNAGLQMNIMGVVLFGLLIVQIPLRMAILCIPQCTWNTQKVDSKICSAFLGLAIFRWAALLAAQAISLFQRMF